MNPTSVQKILAYLQGKGWVKVEDIGTVGQRWTHEDNSNAEVIVALREDSGEYSIRTLEVIATLAQVEGRCACKVRDDLERQGCYARAETGKMQFDQDWSGVFIRGDNALYLAMMLQLLQEQLEKLPEEHQPDVMSTMTLKSTIRLLQEAADVYGEDPPEGDECQKMKDFSLCVRNVRNSDL